MRVSIPEAIAQWSEAGGCGHTYVILEIVTLKRLAAQSEPRERHMPQSNAIEDGIFAGEATVDFQWANSLQISLREFGRYVDLRLEYRDVVTVLDYQQIPRDPVDHRSGARQKGWCSIKLEAQRRPKCRAVGLSVE